MREGKGGKEQEKKLKSVDLKEKRQNGGPETSSILPLNEKSQGNKGETVF
jgi:hypothetical protein